MIEHDFGMARVTVLEEEGRYVAAAKQYWQEGQKLRAVESLFKDETNPEAIRKAKDYILLILREIISFATMNSDSPVVPWSGVATLAKKLLQRSKADLPLEDRLEVTSPAA